MIEAKLIMNKKSIVRKYNSYAISLALIVAMAAVLRLQQVLIMTRRLPHSQNSAFLRPVALLIAGATVAPWVIRNYAQFPSFIPVRDNFGLEFYLSNHPGTHLLITDNFRGPAASALHPTFSPTQAAEVRRIGEVAYNAGQLKQGIAAVRNDPKRFLEMTLARMLWFWFPWSDTPLRDVVSHALSFATLVGLALYLRRQTLQAKFAAVVVVSFPLVYYVLECSTRYRYPIDWLLLLVAAHAVWSAYDWFRAPKPLFVTDVASAK